jgi:MYXO-CTERM domain-containing protein
MAGHSTTAWFAAALIGISGSPASADTVPTFIDVARGTDHLATFTGVNLNGPTSVLVTLITKNTEPSGIFLTAIVRNSTGAITNDAITTAPAEIGLVGGPRFDDTATFAFTVTGSTTVGGYTTNSFLSTTGKDVREGIVPDGILVRFRGGPTSDNLTVTATDPTPLLSPVSTPPAAVLGLIGVLGLLGWRMWTRRRNSVAPA